MAEQGSASRSYSAGDPVDQSGAVAEETYPTSTSGHVEADCAELDAAINHTSSAPPGPSGYVNHRFNGNFCDCEYMYVGVRHAESKLLFSDVLGLTASSNSSGPGLRQISASLLGEMADVRQTNAKSGEKTTLR